jgi:hypothetical protein
LSGDTEAADQEEEKKKLERAKRMTSEQEGAARSVLK